MTERVRLGLIGTGNYASVHARQMRQIPGASIAAMADPSAEKIAAFKELFPDLETCPAYDNHREMLEESALDAVIIASPHHVHCEQIVDSLRAGLHVLAQKPMACSTDEAHRVIEEEKEAGKLVAIGYQRHSQGEFQFIRKCIESGQAGEVQFVSAFQGQNWMKGTTGTWRQARRLSCGGQLNDSGSHLIDVILWLSGLRAKKVSASIEDFDREVDINSALTIEFANGALGSIAIVGNCPLWWEDITIACSEWAFFMRQNRLTYCTGHRGEVLSLEKANYGDGSPDRNFIDAILGKAEVLAPSICGLRVIELTEAAWRSAEIGEAVDV